MNNTQPKLKNQRSWVVYLAMGLLVASLVFVAVTFFLMARNAQHEQQWVSLATEAQVTSQQLAKSAGESASGNLNAFMELGNSRDKIESAMKKLRLGSSYPEFPPAPGSVEVQMMRLNQTWNRMEANATSILDREKLILELASARDLIQGSIPGIQKSTDNTIRTLPKVVRHPTSWYLQAVNWCWLTAY